MALYCLVIVDRPSTKIITKNIAHLKTIRPKKNVRVVLEYDKQHDIILDSRLLTVDEAIESLELDLLDKIVAEESATVKSLQW